MAFNQSVVSEISSVARESALNPAALLAVAWVESLGKPYAIVEGSKKPLIRWEGHYFDRLLKGSLRARARKAGLAHPKAQRVKNPRSQEARYRMLARAMAIDAEAAIASCSWGIGQVMGSHWKKLGYASARDLMREATQSVAGQVRLMLRYVKRFGLMDDLRRLDWSSFARGYNGPKYRKFAYDKKMARAYRRFHGSSSPAPVSSTMLRMGSSGARVRELQVLLRRAGHPVTADGDFGPATKEAVMAFQSAQGLDVDGVVGPATQRVLKEFRTAPDEVVDAVPAEKAEEAVIDTGKGAGLFVLVTTIRNQIAEAASGLLGVENATAETIANLAMSGSAMLGAGLTAYGIWRWWKSRDTREGLA